jgi:M-phase inducer tyrosine phosphatase
LSDYCEPMDISPAAPLKPVHLGEGAGMKPSRPRAFTSGARLFGADISNSSNGGSNSKNLMPSPSLAVDASLNSVRSNSKKIQRSALPTEWLAAPNLHATVRCRCYLI